MKGSEFFRQSVSLSRLKEVDFGQFHRVGSCGNIVFIYY